MEKKTKIFNMRMTSDLHEFVKEMAQKKFTSMSAYIVQLIVKDLENQIGKYKKDLQKKVP